jgi:UDP-glucose 4-epimerase
LVVGDQLEAAYNIGTGTGHSVAQVINVIAEATGVALEPVRVARRPGDPATVVASGDLAQRDLGWNPKTNLAEMVRSAWEAHSLAVAGK